jgi:NAD(P)-dependent dehydrogenase (short-subunit alcohol dehydrogenase family)
VICIARTQGGLEDLDDEIGALAGELGEKAGTAVLVPLDLRDGDAIDRVAFAVHERFDHLDILVGNAGDLGGTLAPLGHYKPKLFQQAFDINVTANYRLIRAFDPLLRRSDAGRAIFVTAAAARDPQPYWGAYGASKAALEVMVKSWAAEVGRITPIRANLLDPGIVATGLRALAFPGEDPATLRQPDEVTDMFVTLAEPAFDRTGELFAPSA